ncbi:class I SAM-dependent DNA methyltransferase [Phytomonospora sp. NPDC050363]|uniref:type I restriction-modification system subunit M n=1 Tax=Phytomonospora sp. NPDC050363 TaxID=3155642 RepID=UPI003410D287
MQTIPVTTGQDGSLPTRTATKIALSDRDGVHRRRKAPVNTGKHQELVNFIWSVANLLRGDYKQADYGKVILPFTALRRFECVLEPTRKKVLAAIAAGDDYPKALMAAAEQRFYNVSGHSLASIAAAPEDTAANLGDYVVKFSDNSREVFDRYGFAVQIEKLREAELLHLVVARFADIDLHPDVVDNHQMGYVFEELIRKFSEASNETAGEHFTPREVIRLMAGLLIAPDLDGLEDYAHRTVYDPACGTGGMLTTAADFIHESRPKVKVSVFGQELNPESWAICRSDLMIKGEDAERIKLGNSFSQDGLTGVNDQFHYMLSNPPFGVEWKKVKEAVEDEAKNPDGRFSAGLPRINDGSLLFLQHMISKMVPAAMGGSRIAIVFNGSPLFTGAAGSGESEIRRWIIEGDLLEAVVALPDQLFYNTGISTYFWILTNRKDQKHKGKVMLIDGREHWTKMRKSLGDKRKMVSAEQIQELQDLYKDALAAAADPEHQWHGKVKVFENDAFGYHRITVERPLKLRFEVTPGAVDELELALKSNRTTATYSYRDDLLTALRTLVGRKLYKKVDFATLLREVFAVEGVDKPPAAVEKLVWAAVSVRDPEGEVQTKKGKPEPDSELRDYENVPLGEDIDGYLEREVKPHIPDAWVDETKTKVGYEISFTRHFYVYTPPRSIAEIDEELKLLEAEIQTLLGEVTQ